MAISAQQQETKRPTGLFVSYAAQLVFRGLLFIAAIIVFAVAPSQLDPANFGFAHGFNFIDFIFLAILVDILTKFFPSAKIAMGSLKQYRQFHVPSTMLLESEGRKESIRQYVLDIIQQGLIAIEQVPEKLRKAWSETYNGAIDSLKVLIKSFSIRKLIPLTDEQLTASDPVRATIRRDRFREVVPVIIFWIIFNALVAVFFLAMGWFTPEVMVLWMLFYFVFDMVSVVLWCPLQLVFMKNRCCTTCQIFNWDAIMTATPLILICWQLASAWFTWPLIILSAVVLIRWEAAFARHPERFDERTNSSLSCANCKDKLCFVHNPLIDQLGDLPDELGRNQKASETK